MTILPAEWASIGGVIVGVIGAVSVALYRRRHTQIRGWVLLVGELQDRVDRLHTAVEAAEARASTAIERAAAAEAQARDAQAQATRLGVLHDVLVAHVGRDQLALRPHAAGERVLGRAPPLADRPSGAIGLCLAQGNGLAARVAPDSVEKLPLAMLVKY